MSYSKPGFSFLPCSYLFLIAGLSGLASAADPPSIGGLSYRRSWIGNSFGTGGGVGGKWVQNNVVAIWVSADGRCYTASSWDEGKRESGIYQGGKLVGDLSDLHPVEGGSWGMGVSAVTGDAQFVYVGVDGNLRRYHPDGTHAPFEGGTGKWKDEVALHQGPGYLQSLAADAPNGRVFASFRGSAVPAKDKTPAIPAPPDEIIVVDVRAMKILSRWPLPRGGRAAVAADGTLWIAQEKDKESAGSAAILHFAPDGKKLAGEITGDAGFSPAALTFDGTGRLLVADNGPDQHVKIYQVTGTPAQVATFGEKGGIFSGLPGEVKPLKFCGLTGLGTDATGNIYVAQNRFGPEVNGSQGAGTIIQSYTSAGRQIWQVHGLEFVDGGDFVPGTDGAQIYSKYSRYVLDPAKAEVGTEWSYAAHTLNQFKYPNDPRFLHRNDHFDFSTTAFVRELGGRRFVFNTSMWARRMEVYRFNPKTDGEIAIPCGYVSAGGGGFPNAPEQGEFIWRDLNANGNPEPDEFAQKPDKGNAGGHANTVQAWWVAENGDLWQGVHWNPNQLRRFPFSGLDPHGCPVWEYAKMETFDSPEPFAGDGVGTFRIEYFPKTDTLYLAGYTKDAPSSPGFNLKLIGRVIARYDGWMKGNRQPTWARELWDANGQANRGPTSMRAEGDFVFIGYDGMPYQPDSGYVRVFRAVDGGYAGRFWAGPNASGRMDITYGVSAHRRANGEYLVLAEEDWYARQMLYRWTPPREKPAVPVIAAKSGNTTAHLSWPSSPNAGFHAVERSDSHDGPFAALARDLETTEFCDTGLTNGKAVFYRVTSGGAAGDAVSTAVHVMPAAATPLRIDAGGAAHGDWTADLYHDGKYVTKSGSAIDTSASGAGPAEMYRSGRVGEFTYTIPGQRAGTDHTLRLHFSEHEGGLVAWRKFNVTINHVEVLKEFNIGGEAGGKANTAVVKEISGIRPDQNGLIVIRFSNAPRFGALINGIEILPSQKTQP